MRCLSVVIATGAQVKGQRWLTLRSSGLAYGQPLTSNVSQRQMPLLQRPARFAQSVRLRALRRPVVVRHGSKFVAGCPRFAGQRTSGVDRPNQCPRLAAPRPCLSKKLNAALREASGRRPHLPVVAGCPRFAGQRTSGVHRRNQEPALGGVGVRTFARPRLWRLPRAESPRRFSKVAVFAAIA